MVAHKAACHTMLTVFFFFFFFFFLEIYEAMVQILLMLKVLFSQDSEVEYLFCGATEPVFSDNLFSLGFESVQDDFQHDFTRRTDEADGSVVLTEL